MILRKNKTRRPRPWRENLLTFLKLEFASLKQTLFVHITYRIFTIFIEIFQGLTGTSPRNHKRKPDKRTNKVYQPIAIKSFQYTSINYFYELFYKYHEPGKRSKVVPYNIKELLKCIGTSLLDYGLHSRGGEN